MLVAAFGGYETVMHAYKVAIEEATVSAPTATPCCCSDGNDFPTAPAGANAMRAGLQPRTHRIQKQTIARKKTSRGESFLSDTSGFIGN